MSEPETPFTICFVPFHIMCKVAHKQLLWAKTQCGDDYYPAELCHTSQWDKVTCPKCLELK